MSRPRLLLVPGISELEWQIKPELEEWAEVASYDPPGVGSNRGEWSIDSCIRRGLEELDRRRWDDYVLVADGWGSWYAVGLFQARPNAVRGFALGHAALSNRMSGDRAPLRGEIWDVLRQLVAQGRDKLSGFAIAQFTRDGYDEKLAAKMLDRIPTPVLTKMLEDGPKMSYDLRSVLRPLERPVLLGKHEECLLFTDEGFEDAVAAFPEARTCSMPKVCAASSVFANELHAYCEEVWV
jgi:pimeloyl-ACP methyl ester carboxylesterase